MWRQLNGPANAATRSLLVVLALPAALACGKDVAARSQDAGASLPIPAECRGFTMEGLRYSPGGEALPNTCEPFDPLTNNPYAVRCVDVMPGYATQFPGDDYCILPPPPEKGAQIGVHPQGPDYWQQVWAGDLGGYADGSVTGPFEVAPGGEIEQTYRVNMENTDARAYYRIDSRMRTGSHHLATYKTTIDGEEGWHPVDGAFVPADADGGFFWNSQRSNADRPVSTLVVPKEDEGIGMAVSPRQGILFDMHHFNTQEAPILREAWINVWWVDGPVAHPVNDEPLVAEVDVPPNTVTDLHGTFAPDADTRILSLFGHRHAWTTRFNAWVHRADGSDEPVYDSFDWLDVPTYSYDSLSVNPVASPEARRDGAASGLLVIHAGDVLRFDCRVDTTQSHAAELGVPVPLEPLVFGNKAFSAEMCILYAQTLQTGAASPGDAGGSDSSAPAQL